MGSPLEWTMILAIFMVPALGALFHRSIFVKLLALSVILPLLFLLAQIWLIPRVT
jgi:hypothetical protein